MKKILYTLLILLLSNISFGQTQIPCSKPSITTTQTSYPVGYDLSLTIFRLSNEGSTDESNKLNLNFIYPNGDTTSLVEWLDEYGEEKIFSVRDGLASADSGWYYVRFRQNGCPTILDSINLSIGQSIPAIQPITTTQNVTFTVDSLSNKDRTHALTLTFNQNHGFKRYTITQIATKLCSDGNIEDTLFTSIVSDTLEFSTAANTVTITKTNQLHSVKIHYQVLLYDSTYSNFGVANTPQGIDGNLIVTHNTAYMLPMKITPDSIVNYDRTVKINIHSEWKPNSSYWFSPSVPSGQIYTSSINNVSRYELWECNSSGQLLYREINNNYFQNNVFIAPGPMGNYGSDKLWSTPIINVTQPCVKYYKIKSIEVYDSCNTYLSNLLTVTFTTKACSTAAITVINNTKRNFEYKFNTVSTCGRGGWEARFYKCNNGNGLLTSNPNLSQTQVATLPLAKVQYKNAEIETLTSTRITLTQTEINQGFFQRKAIPTLTYGNCWYRIDIICAGCSSVTKTRTIYTYVTN
jgi:hypothetical protein